MAWTGTAPQQPDGGVALLDVAMIIVAGAEAHGAYRLPAIACSLIALWIWFTLVCLIGDRTTASFATLALASSFGFLAYADNIHAQAYPLPLQLAALLCCARAAAVEGAARRKWLLGAAETHCPRLLAGGSWIAFEMGPVVAPIMQPYESGTVPTIRELPPPI